MAGLDAVLLDYGDTLFRFRYEQRSHLRALGRLLEALDACEVDPGAAYRAFAVRFPAALAACGEYGELDFVALTREVLDAVGVRASDERLAAAMWIEHRSWDDARELHPQALELLDGLRRDGLRVGIVSNAFDPPEFMHDVLARNGVAERIDAAIFSSELGLRKPAPEIYQAMLGRLDVPAGRALFVGDRVLEDVVGPSRLGMRTCLALYYRRDGGDHSLADFHAREPLDVLELVRGLAVPTSKPQVD